MKNGFLKQISRIKAVFFSKLAIIYIFMMSQINGVQISFKRLLYYKQIQEFTCYRQPPLLKVCAFFLSSKQYMYMIARIYTNMIEFLLSDNNFCSIMNVKIKSDDNYRILNIAIGFDSPSFSQKHFFGLHSRNAYFGVLQYVERNL